jgi:hypothetical protein
MTGMTVTYVEDLVFRDEDVPLGFEELERRRQVLKQVETHPGTLFMLTWERFSRTCGTARCIAGWTQFFARGAVTYDMDFVSENVVSFVSEHGASGPDVKQDAVTLLGLTQQEYFGPGIDNEDFALFYLGNDTAVARLRELCYF